MTSQPDSYETLVLVHGTTGKGPFTAGLVLLRGQVVRAAPILKWSLGWEQGKLSAYFRQRGWTATQRKLALSDRLTVGENDSATKGEQAASPTEGAPVTDPG